MWVRERVGKRSYALLACLFVLRCFVPKISYERTQGPQENGIYCCLLRCRVYGNARGANGCLVEAQIISATEIAERATILYLSCTVSQLVLLGLVLKRYLSLVNPSWLKTWKLHRGDQSTLSLFGGL